MTSFATDATAMGASSASFGAVYAARGGLEAGQTDRTTAALSQAPDKASMRKAAQSFEAMFLTQMFTHMFDGVGKDSLFGGGAGEEMFRPMLLEEYGKAAASRGGLGIADAVMHTLIQQQEKAA